MNKDLVKQFIKEMINNGELKVNLQFDVDKAYIDSDGMVQHGGGGDFVTDIEIFVELEMENEQ
jgi:predicted SnoaL-like aldol condensation-catalyzing enzyme